MLNTKYVAVHYDEKTQRNLRAWCKENNFNLTYKYDKTRIPPSKFVFHTTIVYSTNQFENDMDGEYETEFYVYPLFFETLGVDRVIPVLRVASSELSEVRNLFCGNLCMKDKWDIWKAHISLSYAPDLSKDCIKNLTLPTFPLVVNKIVVKNAE